jgi:hypothetical protein
MKLQNLINPHLLLEITDKQLVLTEEQNENKDNTLKEVIIGGLPDNAIAYSLDKKKIHNQYLAIGTVEYIDKRSDGVLICETENGLQVLICDLKSKNPEIKKCSYKFMTDKLFLDYLIEILNTIFKKNVVISEVKYVIFNLQNGLNDKTTTRTTKEDIFKKRREKMFGFEEYIYLVPFSKPSKNYIPFEKI